MIPIRTPPVEAVALDGPAAARLSGLSAKSLERRAPEGGPVGRSKVGRGGLFRRAARDARSASGAKSQAAPTSR